MASHLPKRTGACVAGRPVQYLADSQLSREELARQIAQRDGIGEGRLLLERSRDRVCERSAL